MRTCTTVRKRVSRWLFRGVVVFAVSILLLACVGAVCEYRGERHDSERFPRKGTLVDIGGYRLSIHCTGQGGPTVVLDSGMGIPAVGWEYVQRDVEKFTRVCSYDRAGYGWSDAGPQPRTSLQIARELHTLLHNAGVPGPYILVGHSFGGFTVRVFNGLYPNEVVGAVLVDSSHEDEHSVMARYFPSSSERKQMITLEILSRLYPAFVRVGVARLFWNRDDTGLSEPMESELHFLLLKPKHIRAFADEAASYYGESSEEVRRAGDFGSKPLWILTAGNVPLDPDLPKSKAECLRGDLFNLQWGMIQLSSKSQQVIVQGSGHDIQIEKPKIIVDAIKKLSLDLSVNPLRLTKD